jgi:2-amino-4-hydroxy-6-hydroxymethyldihydropteridine diphosphokinase
VVLIGIGANLPGADGASPLETCEAAARAVAALPALRVHSISQWYETTPIPPSDQPNYINGVARFSLASAVAPEQLLAELQAIEHRFDRRRGEPNAARTLDLDLIDMDGLVRDSPDPVLPHPRAHLRAFVLVPLLDVAPDWVHPRLDRPARALLEQVGRAGVTAMRAPAGGRGAANLG